MITTEVDEIQTFTHLIFRLENFNLRFDSSAIYISLSSSVRRFINAVMLYINHKSIVFNYTLLNPCIHIYTALHITNCARFSFAL
jgi:hypothetical protein